MNKEIKIYLDQIKIYLDKKVIQYNNKFFIKNDPIQIPHLFKYKKDIEISGLLTSVISWGNRKLIIKKAINIFERMDYSPYDFIMNYKISDLKYLKNFKYRTFKSSDLFYFLKSIKNIYKNYCSLEKLFYINKNENNTINCINRFRNIFFSIPHEYRIRKHISNPVKGSSCKRINMYLRWMCRDDKKVDLGIWKTIPKSKLSCPLDIHSFNIARKLGLILRKKNDLKSLIELDRILRIFDKEDPAKYDFALFGIGIFENF